MALKKEIVSSPDGVYKTHIWEDEELGFTARIVRMSNMAISVEVEVKGETLFNDLVYVDTLAEARETAAKFYHAELVKAGLN